MQGRSKGTEPREHHQRSGGAVLGAPLWLRASGTHFTRRDRPRSRAKLDASSEKIGVALELRLLPLGQRAELRLVHCEEPREVRVGQVPATPRSAMRRRRG